MNKKAILLLTVLLGSTAIISSCENSEHGDRSNIMIESNNGEVKELPSSYDKKTDRKPDNALGVIKDIFPDEIYAQAIAEALGKEVTEYTTKEELSTIKSELSHPGDMSSLEGIRYLTGMETFDCCKNLVSSVPAGIENAKGLRSFDICKSSIGSIPVELFNCKELIEFRTVMSGVDKLPKEVGNLKKLESMILNINTDIPKEIGELKNLKLLMAERSNIPEEVKFLVNLEQLKIHSSNVSEIIDHIGELKNLKVLDLGGCNLEVFPDGILELENLERLNLFGNDIKKIPKEIGNLKKLTYLNTYDNYNLDEDYKQYLANEELRKQ